MEQSLVTRILAAVASKNRELRSMILACNPLTQVAKQTQFAPVVERIIAVAGSADYDSAAVRVVEDWVFDQIEERTGLRIEELSEKAVAEAIGRRAGVELSSLTDAEAIKGDLINAGSARMAARMGWSLDRQIRTVEDLEAELRARAASVLESRVAGLELPARLDDAGLVGERIMQWAGDHMRKTMDVPISDVGDVERTRAALLRWAEPQILRRMQRAGKTRQHLKMTKKAISDRNAQRKFYSTHGNRHRYTPVG